jgi:hypothetical protein
MPANELNASYKSLRIKVLHRVLITSFEIPVIWITFSLSQEVEFVYVFQKIIRTIEVQGFGTPKCTAVSVPELCRYLIKSR